VIDREMWYRDFSEAMLEVASIQEAFFFLQNRNEEKKQYAKDPPDRLHAFCEVKEPLRLPPTQGTAQRWEQCSNKTAIGLAES